MSIVYIIASSSARNAGPTMANSRAAVPSRFPQRPARNRRFPVGAHMVLRKIRTRRLLEPIFSDRRSDLVNIDAHIARWLAREPAWTHDNSRLFIRHIMAR